MSSIGNVGGSNKLASILSQNRFSAEPKSKLGLAFDAASGLAKSLLGTAGSVAGASTLGGIGTEYTSILAEQIRVQQEMQVVSMQ